MKISLDVHRCTVRSAHSLKEFGVCRDKRNKNKKNEMKKSRSKKERKNKNRKERNKNKWKIK